jgi:hypothetical protein
MAWIWKQGRPSLLAMIGLGVLGYKALHRGREEARHGPQRIRVIEGAQPRKAQVTPMPLDRQAQTAFLGA